MNGGYVKMFRKAFESHPFWLERRRFSRWEAMQWLIVTAPWGDGYIASFEGHEVPVPRGHVLVSSRLLSSKWQWANASVWRFLKRLESEKTIETVRETPIGTLYLLVNYELYQGDGTADETPDEIVNETPVKQRRNENNTNKQKRTTQTEYSPDFEFFWNAYPKREGGDSKPKAFKAFRACLNRGVAYDQMLEKVREYSGFVIEKGWVGTRFVYKASNWLGAEEGFNRDWRAVESSPESRSYAGVTPISRGPIQW